MVPRAGIEPATCGIIEPILEIFQNLLNSIMTSQIYSFILIIFRRSKSKSFCRTTIFDRN
jgi:hypothetical protein